MSAVSAHVVLDRPRISRRPVWSGLLTAPPATVIPAGRRPVALSTIKAIHTAIFASVGGAILLLVWDGLRQRPARRTVVAAAIVLGESAIYASNNQVCPLTPLAEELGASRGSVADIYLPDWLSRRIQLFGGSALLLGLALNALAVWRRLRSEPVSPLQSDNTVALACR